MDNCLPNEQETNCLKIDGTYVTLQSWMVSELGLRGNELICFSIIYGFCQDGSSEFTGSRSYLCEWIGCTLPTIDKILRSLVSKGLIEKNVCNVGGVPVNSYRICLGGYKNSLQGIKKFYRVLKNFTPRKEILQGIKNFYRGSEDKNTCEMGDLFDGQIVAEKVDKVQSPSKDELFQKFGEFVALYKKLTGKAVRSVRTEFDDFKSRHKDWAAVIPYLSVAIIKEDKARKNAEANGQFFPCPKMLQTYLGKQRAWEMYVTVGEDLDTVSAAYMPIESPMLAWDDTHKCYIYIGGFYDGVIYDGYDDDNRPDGAVVMLNNARGTLRWDSHDKKWNKI